jgi:methyl-accepting chemotaxis protein
VARGIRDAAHASGEARSTVERAAASFDGILEATRRTTERAQAITDGAGEQRRAARQVDEALERIVRIARENARGTEETSRATGGQTASIQRLAGSAHELARTADTLKGLLSTFKLRE